MKKLFLVASLIVLSSSAQAIEHSNKVIVTDEDMIQGCQNLETLEAPAEYRMIGTPGVALGFKSEVLKKAEQLGATHITLTYEDSQLRRTAYGRIYKCSGVNTLAKQ